MRRSRSLKLKEKDSLSLRREILKSKDKSVNTIADSFAKRGKKDKEKEGRRQNVGLTDRNDKNHLEEDQVITKKSSKNYLMKGKRKL